MSARPFIAAPWAVLAAAVAASAASFAYLGVDFIALFTGDSASQMARFAAGFFPPDLSPEFVARTGRGVAETLAISALGTILAAAGGALLALPASGRWSVWLRPPARLVLNVLRAIPELVWAVFMVLAAGLGPFAGCLALAVHTSGVLGRLFAETLENAPPEPAAALRNAGSGATVAFLYGTLPVVLPQYVSYALYRWEYNIRMAAVLGFVGAGGLGQMLYVSLSVFKTHEASTLILAMIAIVTVVDVASAWLRRFLGS
ncbi:MAG: phosphonate ABC transporter, permease protein PhnE [Betaproteobacteria bacterium RIFCSPLOWO2_02_FULL_67_19]|nr:MAG: phosphonate ABC transporter, permease protein PhnE [Betaproteobacteria bacterium RIFCSPLOWO2_02_FULL_67_19]